MIEPGEIEFKVDGRNVEFAQKSQLSSTMRMTSLLTHAWLLRG